MKKIIALVLALVMLILPLMACKDDEGEIMGSKNPYKSSEIVLKSENFSYTRAEFSIAFHQYYMDFFYDNENLDFYNVDTEASLKDQVYHDDVTWFDYFADMSVEYMTTVLTLCEGAKATGLELSEEELETIEEAVDSFVRYANDYGYTEDEYFATVFGKDVKQDDLREYYKKEALAAKYEENVISSYEFTDDELLKHTNDNKKTFYTIDYVFYTFDEDDDVNAKASAEALAKITDVKAFDDYILSYMTDTLKLGEEKRTTEDCYKYYKYYDEYSEFSKWAFDSAEAGSTYIKTNEVDGLYTVYLLTKAPAIRDDRTKNVRIITVDVNEHETSAKALEYAEELLKEWEDGEKTEESFIKLVNHEGNDANDGLIEGISRGEALPEGLEDWLFAEDTVTNSAKVFGDTGYYYVVYYSAEGEIKWKKDARAALVSENYGKEKEALSEKYKVEKFEKVINSLDV